MPACIKMPRLGMFSKISPYLGNPMEQTDQGTESLDGFLGFLWCGSVWRLSADSEPGAKVLS